MKGHRTYALISAGYVTYFRFNESLALLLVFVFSAQVDDDQYKDYLEQCVRPMIDHLMSLKFPSGNYPSSIESKSGDKLVHWCHGAPGWVYMFILAHRVSRQYHQQPPVISVCPSSNKVHAL